MPFDIHLLNENVSRLWHSSNITSLLEPLWKICCDYALSDTVTLEWFRFPAWQFRWPDTAAYAYVHTCYFRGIFFPVKSPNGALSTNICTGVQFNSAFAITHEWSPGISFSTSQIQHSDSVTNQFCDEIKLRQCMTDSRSTHSVTDLQKHVIEHCTFIDRNVCDVTPAILDTMFKDYTFVHDPVCFSDKWFAKTFFVELCQWIHLSSFQYHLVLPVSDEQILIIDMAFHPRNFCVFWERCENQFKQGLAKHS
jgi:hypothetical protein